MKNSAGILEQISRRIPSSFTDAKLYVDAGKFLNRADEVGVSVGINYGEYDYPKGAKYPVKPLRGSTPWLNILTPAALPSLDLRKIA
eukprot:1948444-Alexandrium_andersonii.AAC.1